MYKLDSTDNLTDLEGEGHDDFHVEDDLLRSAKFKKESLSLAEKRLVFKRILDSK